MAGADQKVNVGANTSAAKAQVNDLRAYLNQMAAKNYQFRMVADDKDAQARLTSLYGQLLRLDKTIASPKLNMQGIARAQAALLGIDAQMDRLSQKVSDVHVDIDDGDAERRLALLTAQVTALGAKTANVKIDMADPASEIVLGSIVARLAQIQQMSSKIDFRVDTGQLATAEAQLAMLAADFTALTTTEEVAAASTRSFGGLFSTIMKLLTTQVALFGGALPGMLGEVAVWHILSDLVIEFAAVLGPAIIAMGVFGAVAIPTAKNIFTQMKNVYTVTQATGQALYPLGDGFSKLAAAVQPSVYQLFGDALTLMNSKSGDLATSLKQTGSVIDTFGARIAVALSSVSAGNFFATANQDLAKLGDELGNIFGIAGNLAKTMPGYANVLLGVFDSATKGLENLTGSGATQQVINWGLSFHGAYLYTGLIATAFGKVATGGLSKIGDLAEKASMALGGIGKASEDGTEMLTGLGAIAQKASLGMGGLAAGAAEAAAIPWTWVGVAAAGIGILVYKLLTAKDAAQQWFDALEKGLQAQNAVKGLTSLQDDQAIAADKLQAAQSMLFAVTQKLMSQSGGQLSQADKGTAAYLKAAQASRDYGGALTTLTDQSVLYNTRLDKLAIAFGGVGEAQGILLASGVTMKQMLTGGTEGWLMIAQQVSATDAAYRAMGQTQGILGADMNALNIAASAQVTQMTNVNKAFDTVIGIVSGGQGTFVTFEQSISAVAKAAQSGGASMTGLANNSLALRAAFQTAYGNASKMIDALRMMVSASPDASSGSFPALTGAMKDTIAQMLPLGSKSAATQAELVSLAQEINPAINNFQELVKWIGNVKNPGEALDKIISGMGVNMQSLAKDASGLYASLQSDIINQFNLAKLSGSGASAAIKALGEDITTAGTKASKTVTDTGSLAIALHAAGMSASDASSLILSMVGHISLAGDTASQKHAELVTLYNDFRQAGLSAKQATDLVHDLTGELLKVPKNTSANVNLHASGSGTISASETLPGSKTAQVEKLIFGNKGIRIPGYGGGDKHPAMLEAGETVVPKHLTPAIAPLMKAHGVPGFSAGGTMSQFGSQAMNVTPWAAGAEAGFAAGDATQWAKQLVAKAQADLKAEAAASIGGASGPGGGAPGANAALARSLYANQLTPTVWAAWNAVAMRESGWNNHALNASSGAYGIPQALPPTKMPFAAQAAGGSNPTAQIHWMWNYMAGRYGGPIGAEQHEQSAGWYAHGTPGAARGWGVVGEYGPELVSFHGGEQVIPHAATRKIIGGGMGRHGYATGTPVKAPVKKPNPNQAKWLKELAADVTKENKLVAARTKHRKQLALGIYQAELYDIQHPHDKKGPVRLKALDKANTAYLTASGKPIALLQKEVSLLRALTGEPKGAKYGATTTAATATTTVAGTSVAGSSASGTSASSSAASAAQLAQEQALAAKEMQEFAQGILPSSGDTSPSGISVGSAPGSTATTGIGTSTGGSSGSSGSAGGIGSMFPSAAMTAPVANGSPVSSIIPGLSVMSSQLERLISVTRAAPGQNAAGFQSVMGGVARGARQGARFNTRG